MDHKKSGTILPPPAAYINESMTVMAFASDNRAVGFNVTARIEAALEAYKAARAKRKIYNRTVAELSSLSGAELADIGLTRGMIRAVAREAADLG